LSQKNASSGYNAASEKYVDMMAAGIIDPSLVVCSALEHASSAAKNLLSIGCALVEDDSDVVDEESLYST